MNIHGGYRGDLSKVIDLSININPSGPPKGMKEGFQELFSTLRHYPSIDGSVYEKRLKKRFNLGGEVLLGNGAMELIYLFARSTKGRRVMIIQPTFNEYERAFFVAGWEISHFLLSEEADFQLDLTVLEKRIRKERPDVLVLCHPNNPTGTVQTDQTLADLCNLLEGFSIPLMLDGSFIDFFEGGWSTLPERIRQFIAGKGIGICSLTKFYGIPGVRLGYAFGGEDIMEKMSRKKEPWTINAFAFQALEWILEDHDFEGKTLRWLKSERKFMDTELKGVRGIKSYPSKVNFSFVKAYGRNKDRLQQALLEKGVYIRSCTDFYGLDEKYYRFAIGSRTENEKLITALKEAGDL